MPHQITNRRRSYERAGTGSGGHEFLWEALNALAYIVGGVTFVTGSVLFLPAFEQYSAAAAGLFILGSALYLAVTVTDLLENVAHYRHHRHPGKAVFLGLANTSLYVLGSVLFLIGSVCFMPGIELKTWGAVCFIVANVLFIIGACINVTQITRAGSLFTLQLLNVIAICFVIGSVLFLVACIPYLWNGVSAQDQQTLFTYLGAEFIFGSLLFLAGGIVNFYRAHAAHRQHHPRQKGSAEERSRGPENARGDRHAA